ncbi:MAG TPA: aminopeptidase N [Nocardioidaceae bacterium]|nr:aminopeptidase N [Nocardioidaceae bacterium]
MPSLSLDESRRRAALLEVTSYDVTLDLTGDEKTFTSRTVIHFTAHGDDETFLDVKPVHLSGVQLNGRPLEVGDLRDGRLPLRGLAGENELVVDAVMGYRNDGEGLHRAVDPADGLHYTYAMSFLDAAPRIFACFDQPDLKAPYTFHVSAPEDWVVVGNGRAEQVEPGRCELATTQPLSTYFVTLVAGPYHVVTSEHDGIALGLECRASLAEHLDKDAEEIFTVTAQCFDEFHRLFGVRYAFGDYHQAFVPEFNAGAMENPGCVTFRDPLVFTSKVTRAERTNRATTIAHEMAHQWFGDLVTMRWWDDLWLNESFAEYMGNRVAHDATEFTDAWVDTGFVRKRWGMEADQRPSTHPVAGNGATDAVAALQDFDGISYAKGSAVLKQLNSNLGDEVFFAGVREHFARHRFGNATMHDLFSAWEDAGAGDLSGWTQGWLRTAGPDLIRLDRAGNAPVLRRTTPEQFPADRVHALSVARQSSAGWVVEPVVVGADPVALPAEAATQPVVIDPRDQTWARLGVDELTLAALPDLLPSMTDPVMRASVWSAVRDGVSNALVDPEVALHLVEVGLPQENQDIAVGTLSLFALSTLADRLCPDPAGARRRLHDAALARLATAPGESGVQLAAARAVVSSSTDPARLRAWLAGDGLPDGLAVDLDLRWRILVRLATLGAVDRDELHRELERERTAQAAVHLVNALASLPDAEAKKFAWDHFSGAVSASNYEIEAAGTGMWRRGQEHLTDEYVQRYFDEVAGTASIRSGWVLADAAREFFPRLALAPETVSGAERVLADDALDLSLRRALVDSLDQLRRDLRAREVFPPAGR